MPEKGSALEALSTLITVGKLPTRRVSVAIPDSLLAIRYFTLPTQDDDEIANMVSHQLGLVLPVGADQLCWTLSKVQHTDGGETIVMIHVIRRDQLDWCLTPFREAGLTVERAVPEGRALARMAHHIVTSLSKVDARLDTNTESHEHGLLGRTPAERSTLLLFDGRLHIVVELRGDLVFHRSFAAPVLNAQDLSTQMSDELGQFLHGSVKSARDAFVKALGRSIPEPLIVFPDLWSGTANKEAVEALATRLRERFHMAVACAIREPEFTEPTKHNMPDPFAASLAEVGATNESFLATPEMRAATTRREAGGSILQFVILTAMLLGVGALFAFADMTRMQEKLALLREQVSVERAQLNELDTMRSELARLARKDANSLVPIRVLSSVQTSAPRELRLRTFNLVPGRPVTLQGSAKAVATISDFADRLSEDPLWTDVRVMNVRKSGDGEQALFQFEIQGQVRDDFEPGAP